VSKTLTATGTKRDVPMVPNVQIIYSATSTAGSCYTIKA